MSTNHKGQLRLPFEGISTRYEPRFDVTEKTSFFLDAIARDRWQFEHLIVDPKYVGWIKRRAFIRSGHHSLSIEGNRLTEDEVADILDNPDVGVTEGRQQEEVRAWNRAMQFVDSISDNPGIPITSLLIRHVHQLILGPTDWQGLPGEYRRGDTRVRHPVTRKPAYTGPLAGDVPDLMYQFETWLSKEAPAIHPVLVAGIAHLRLVEIHPFVDGNGRTARALTTLILQRHGYSFNRMLALERYFDLDLLKYCETISATVGESFEEGRDLSQWLEYFTLALTVEVTRASDAFVDLRRMMENWHSVLSAKGYSERHRDILAYAVINDGVRPRDVIKTAKVSSVTASSDLKRLTDASLLIANGQGRARVFRPTGEFWENLK